MNRRDFVKLLAAACLSGACRQRGDDQLFKGGTPDEEHWTFDVEVQAAIRQHIAAPLLDKVAKNRIHANADAACVLMHNETGNVLGYLATIRDDSQFDCADHARNSGSVSKPLLYAAALQTHAVAPDETFLDAKMSFPCPECSGRVYSPDNYGGRYTNTQLTLTEALARSSNMVMLQVMRRMNMANVLPILAALGLPAPTNYNTMALGWDISPLALCSAMTALPNRGAAVRPRFTWRQTVNGRSEDVAPERTRPIFDPGVSSFVIEAMRACLTRGTGRAASDLSSCLAGKTGSSDSAWAALCGPKITAALWIGRRDSNLDIGYTGGALAMPLLAAAMRSLKRSRADLLPDWEAAGARALSLNGHRR